MTKLKMPKNALIFNENHDAFAKSKDDKSFEMLAYSGKVIKNHFWWGNLIIDMAGMKFSKSKYPILQNHDTDKKIGFVSKPKDVGNELRFDNITYVDTAESTEFQKLSQEGFPYEASIYAQPTKITRLREGESAEVNGMKFKGPGTIWDEATFKEASVTVFGYDSQTKSQAFSENDEIEIEVSQELSNNELSEKEIEKQKFGGPVTMNIEQLKKDHPDLYKEVFGIGEAKARLTFKAKETTLTEENEKLQGKVTTLSETVQTQGESIEKLESHLDKEKALKAAEVLKAQADKIWTAKLSDSYIDEDLHEKAARMVTHSRFVEEGKLNVEKFETAVDAEIKDWESRLTKETPESDGFGTSHKKETLSDEQFADDAAWEKEMSGFAGVALEQ